MSLEFHSHSNQGHYLNRHHYGSSTSKRELESLRILEHTAEVNPIFSD